MKRGIFICATLLLLLTLMSGCLNEKAKDFIYIKSIDGNGSSGTSDTNKVAVSSNDTLADFLSEKIVAGTNVTLTILNPGGDEQIQINASGSGGSDTNKVAVSNTDTIADFLISKIVPGFGIDFVQLNPGANESLRVDLNASIRDLNDVPNSFAGQALKVLRINSDENSIEFAFVNVSGDLNWLELNEVIPWQDVNVANDITVDWAGLQNYPAGCPVGEAVQTIGDTLICVSIASGDLNWAELNLVIPWQDVNIASSSKWNADINWDDIISIMPLGDVNIANASLYKATCDNNNMCTITGKITTVLDANFNNIKFTGTLSGGDFNYSLSDANGSQNCAAGFALSSVGAVTACVALASGGDLNWAALNQVIPWQDVNVSNDLTINSTKDGNFQLDLNVGDDLTVGDDVNVGDDLNVGDAILGKTLTLTKDPTFGSIIYGDNNTAILIPFLKTTNIFGSQGFPAGTGMSFDFERSAIVIELAEVPSFFVTLSLTDLDSLIYMKPKTTLPDGSLLGGELRFNAIGKRQDIDGNHIYCHDRDLNNWAQCGTRHSIAAPPFLFQSGDFNGSNIRFFGSVDFNQTIDVNGSGTFTGDVNITQGLNVKGNADFNSFAHFDKNVQIDQNLTVDGNIMLPTGCLKISDIAICPNTVDGNGGLLIYDFQ